MLRDSSLIAATVQLMIPVISVPTPVSLFFLLSFQVSFDSE
jgi:hypothetical protein